MANVVTINSKTGSQVQLTDVDGTFFSVPPYGAITATLDDATYARAVAIFGAANVTLATAAGGGLSGSTTPMPDLIPPVMSAGGYQAADLPVLQSILVELRVIAELLNRNTQNADLYAMRADEVNNATGGSLN